MPWGNSRAYKFDRVTRVTKAHIIVGHDLHYRRSDGRLVGATQWSSACIMPPTDERRQITTIHKLRLKADSMIHKVVLPDDQPRLEALIAAIKPYVPESPGG